MARPLQNWRGKKTKKIEDTKKFEMTRAWKIGVCLFVAFLSFVALMYVLLA
jgi:hypothetical protein